MGHSIDREKVISIFEKIISVCKEDGCDFVDLSFEDAEQILALLKEQERKTGSWDYGTQCSVCKGTIIPPKDRKIRVNFCPWCGADMRGDYDA